MTLNEEGSAYTIKSVVNEASIVNLTVTRAAPGFQVGKDGKTYYGTDPKHPWGSMRHAFWPRCKVEGSIATKSGNIDFGGKGLFVHALQGMKPHHAGRFRSCLLHSTSDGQIVFLTTLSCQVEFRRLPVP